MAIVFFKSDIRRKNRIIFYNPKIVCHPESKLDVQKPPGLDIFYDERLYFC